MTANDGDSQFYVQLDVTGIGGITGSFVAVLIQSCSGGCTNSAHFRLRRDFGGGTSWLKSDSSGSSSGSHSFTAGDTIKIQLTMVGASDLWDIDYLINGSSVATATSVTLTETWYCTGKVGIQMESTGSSGDNFDAAFS